MNRTDGQAASPHTTEFLNLNFHQLDLEEVVSWLAQRREDDAFAYLVTPNVDHIVQIQRDPRLLYALYKEADLCVCDSRILAGLGRCFGRRLAVVPGSDLVMALFDRVIQPRDRICLIGGLIEDAEALRLRYPDIDVVHHAPPMGLRYLPEARLEAAEAARAAQARFTLLAVGCPQQELIAWEIKQQSARKGTALCIGAAVDFVIGKQKRAPKMIQRVGMEWAWRLVTDPRRLMRRYLVDGPHIIPIVFRWWRRSVRKHSLEWPGRG